MKELLIPILFMAAIGGGVASIICFTAAVICGERIKHILFNALIGAVMMFAMFFAVFAFVAWMLTLAGIL